MNVGLQLVDSKVADSTFEGTEGNPGVHDLTDWRQTDTGSSIVGCSFVGAVVQLEGYRCSVVGNSFRSVVGQGNNTAIEMVVSSQLHSIVGNTFHGRFQTVSPAIVMSGVTAFINITANVFTDSGIDLGGGLVQQVTINSNTFHEGCSITSNAGAGTDHLQAITIVGNEADASEQGGWVLIEFTGASRVIYDINIEANSLYNQENTTQPLIHIASGASGDFSAYNIRVVGNKLSQESNDPLVLITGIGTGDGNVVVRDNDCEGSRGGIEISDVREAIVKNNDLHPIPGFPDTSYVQQIVVHTVNTAIVDGNSAVTGPYGDSISALGAVIYVSATDGGSVRDNDVWGENVVADLETAFIIDGPFWVQGNRYQGIFEGSVGSPFDNAIVVTGTGAIIGENGSPVDYSGATAPIVDESARGESALEIGINSHGVVHGLTFIPQTVLITPYGNQLIWVSDIGATTFTVDRANPTSSRLEFGWLADYESEGPPPRAVGSAVSAGDGVITIT